MTTKEIEAKMKALVPGFDLGEFAHKAERHMSCEDMADEEYYPEASSSDVDEEFIRQNGSDLKTAQALKDVTIPLFSPEFAYMERLSSLRQCERRNTGYKISPALAHGLATNLKMIGLWQRGDGEVIVDNHQPVVPQELFLEAYRLAVRSDKPRGKASHYEPTESSGLLWCLNHGEPRHISTDSVDGRYSCHYDYDSGSGPICMDITGRFLDEPRTATVLSQLDFTPYAEEVLDWLPSEAANGRLEQFRHKQQIGRLEQDIRKMEALIPVCVDVESGRVDREKEKYYWERKREAEKQLANLKGTPAKGTAVTAIDFAGVRELLKGLSQNWKKYSVTWRNRLLRLLIERVELRGTYDMEATIVWKTGLRQMVPIHRPSAKGRRERRWADAEDSALRSLYSSSSTEVVMAALPGRSWKGITLRAFRLGFGRKWYVPVASRTETLDCRRR